MRYIKTKNGQIIAFLDEDRETKLPKRDLRFYFTKPDKVIAFIGKDEIVKQDDTIEELSHHPEVKVTNLVDFQKVECFEIIKKNFKFYFTERFVNNEIYFYEVNINGCLTKFLQNKKDFDLLKEHLK